jgi:hypothetical protein
MVHNYILVWNWLRILGKQKALIFNIASVHLPDMMKLGRVETRRFSPNPASLGREGVSFLERKEASRQE